MEIWSNINFAKWVLLLKFKAGEKDKSVEEKWLNYKYRYKHRQIAFVYRAFISIPHD